MATEPQTREPRVPSIPERLRAVLGDHRSFVASYIAQAREEFASPLSDKELTLNAIKKIPAKTDMSIADTLLRRDEDGEADLWYDGGVAADEMAFMLTRLFAHTEERDEDRANILFDALQDEDFVFVSDLTELVGLDINTPAQIEIIDWEEKIYRYDLEYHPSDPASQKIENIAGSDMVLLTTPQVQYIYETDLPGIKFVMQFPVSHNREYSDAGDSDYEQRTHDGVNYDFPRGLRGLHSIRLAVAPEAYVESLKESPAVDPS